jgi:acyl-coenzyme A synthetase/AMP-(fatty) acid ligase
VVPAEGDGILGLAALREALAGVLAPSKLPEDLRVLASIPRTRLGKIDLAALRAAAEREIPRALAQR